MIRDLSESTEEEKLFTVFYFKENTCFIYEKLPQHIVIYVGEDDILSISVSVKTQKRCINQLSKIPTVVCDQSDSLNLSHLSYLTYAINSDSHKTEATVRT